ncbi:MAG: dTDP-4-dehydrorhamnose 3,5-epimerase family protein [Rhodocyclales bacterium]|nr:dTDP-4-dehydrorhamnose 3,5-epimerase family protein [Rhodocyclales bacterium]
MTLDWRPVGGNGRFLARDTAIAGLRGVRRLPREDSRGSLERLYCPELFAELEVQGAIRQINRSITLRQGTLRGLHFQHPPHTETKFVQCLRGAVFDVAVDLRRGSPTLLHWHGQILSAANGVGLLIPDGFAHGMQTLEDDTELLYLHTADYVPTAEDGLDPFDPRLNIAWPLPPTDLSERDRNHPHLPPDFAGLLP